jgi:SAM-dependent methyltransferase
VTSRHLEAIRTYELDLVLKVLPGGGRVLEVGAGSGWQARRLAARSFVVEAIDLADTIYKDGRVWPVQEYDGIRIPFPDKSFDIVFTSNVLEHIPHVEAFQAELLRVLKPEGLCVHVLPTAAWRFWTTAAHYVAVVKVGARWLFARRSRPGQARGTPTERVPEQSWLQKLRGLLVPTRHGEHGNGVSELYLFSRFRWRALFRRFGWSVRQLKPNCLFYTGYAILGDRLSLAARHALSYPLGSSCHIFVLKPGADDA